jgi:cellulose synthase/poly-beta-1,6-N-acetylglucosamine synthase-like glycosyltransferase
MNSAPLASSKPLYYLAVNPRQWIRASLPKFQGTAQAVLSHAGRSQTDLLACPWSQRHEYLHACAVKEQERRWEEQTGIAPADAHFTLMVPIYNEEPSLPSFLATLMLVDLPASAHVNILLITNACTDASVALIQEFFSRLGPVQERQLSGVYHDQRLQKTCQMVRQGHLNFIHVHTETPGKANALAVGNQIAREDGHTIAISIDANNYVEPDAVRILFAHARQLFSDHLKTGDTVLISGDSKIERRASPLARFFRRTDNIKEHFLDMSDENGVTGCLMAWNTVWMERIGGPPRVALEDYAMGILARGHHYAIKCVKEASIWIYETNTIQGMLETKARYFRGMLQLLALADDPAMKTLIQKDAYFTRDFSARWQYLLRRIQSRPWHLPRYVAAFLVWECALRKGKREYRKDPANYSWKKISSTY